MFIEIVINLNLILTEDRNSRMLLIKNINKKVTESDIKNLSNDIIDVTVKVYYRAHAEDGKKVKKSYGSVTN